MQKDIKNKAITGDKEQPKVETKTEKREYFFPGGGERKPETIQAASRDEAVEKYKNRK